MIYDPNPFENAEYFEQYTEERIVTLFRELVDKRDEMLYDDRIDMILIMLDHLGYTWDEYREERRQTQYYIDMKKGQIK